MLEGNRSPVRGEMKRAVCGGQETGWGLVREEGSGRRRKVCVRREHTKMLTVLLEKMKALEVEKDYEVSVLARS